MAEHEGEDVAVALARGVEFTRPGNCRPSAVARQRAVGTARHFIKAADVERLLALQRPFEFPSRGTPCTASSCHLASRASALLTSRAGAPV